MNMERMRIETIPMRGTVSGRDRGDVSTACKSLSELFRLIHPSHLLPFDLFGFLLVNSLFVEQVSLKNDDSRPYLFLPLFDVLSFLRLADVFDGDPSDDFGNLLFLNFRPRLPPPNRSPV